MESQSEARFLRLLAQERDGRRERSRDVGHQVDDRGEGGDGAGRSARRRTRPASGRDRGPPGAEPRPRVEAGGCGRAIPGRRTLRVHLDDRGAHRCPPRRRARPLTAHRWCTEERREAARRDGAGPRRPAPGHRPTRRRGAPGWRPSPRRSRIRSKRCGRRRRPFPSVSDKRLPRRTTHSMHWRRACPNSPSRPNPRRQMPATVSEIISVGEATDGPPPELPDPGLGVDAGPSERAAPSSTD